MSLHLASRAGTGRLHRRVVGIAVLLALAGLIALVVWCFVWPAEELAVATEALRLHDISEARARFERYRSRWPKDAKALLLAARAAAQAGDFADAERLIGEHDALAGATSASRREWALLGTLQGDCGNDESWLLSLAEGTDADALAALDALAKGYQVACRWQDALRILNKLIERDPIYSAPLIQRGTIRRHLLGPHEAERSAEDFRHALALTPESVAGHAALAGALSDMGFIQEAVDHYESVLKLRPGNPAALLGIARLLTDSAKLIEAEQRLDELLAAHPDHADGLVERGRLALRRGQAENAESLLARAVKAAPWHRDAHRLYLTALRELKHTEAAAQCEAKLAKQTEGDAAGARLKSRLANAPNDSGILWELYQWNLRNGETGEGFACLVEVARLAPTHGPAQAALAEHFERAGQPRRAAQHRALAGSPRP